MSLVRFYHPHYSVNQSLVDELFDNLLRNDHDEDNFEDCKCKPATNIFENDKEFRLELFLPGYKKEDVQLKVHENLLTVKVDRDEENESDRDGFKFKLQEFGTHNFERHYKVPKSVASEKINARFENGILRLTLPKKEEAIEKAPVEIKIG